MTQTPKSSTSALWARFRFSIVGPLLSSPPARGALKTTIRSLAGKTWRHPVTGCDVQFAVVSIERWYYMARRERDDPLRVLRRAVRRDCGKVSLAPALAERLHLQYRDHPHWSYQLHYDNLAALVEAEPSLGRLRCYSTVRRYMLAHGWVRKPRLAPQRRPGEARAEERRQTREIRSGITISVTSPCAMPVGTSAGSIWSTRAAGRFWLPFILWIKAPTPTAAVPQSSLKSPSCRPIEPAKANAPATGCRRF